MKRITIFSLVILAAAAAAGQCKLDARSQTRLETWRAHKAAGLTTAPGDAKATEISSFGDIVSALVALHSHADATLLAEAGYEVEDMFGSVAMVSVRLDDIDNLIGEECVIALSFGGMKEPTMNAARTSARADAVISGTDADLNRAYTGKGVMVGLHDSGLDPNHINFMDADGNSRVTGVRVVTGPRAGCTDYETPTEIATFRTENTGTTHGTHVLGIMTGSYSGPGRFCADEPMADGDIPFHGVAPEASIAIACGDLYDSCILKGVEYVIEKARENNMPAVINLSLGTTNGPHDGSDEFCRSLAALGEDAIILLSAGNDGNIPMSLHKTFTTDDTALKTFFAPYNTKASGNAVNTSDVYNGDISIYASDGRPFRFSLAVVNINSLIPMVVSSVEINESTGGVKTYIGGSESSDAYLHLDKFDSATSPKSYLTLSSNVSPVSGKYSLTIDHHLSMADTNPAYALAIIIEGEPGQTLSFYANVASSTPSGVRSTFTDRGYDGWENGTCNGSISSMACGDNVIVVGAYTTRSRWYNASGTLNSYGYGLEDIAPFSSYGTLDDGTSLPHITAPGSQIVSSISKYYSRLNEDALQGIVSTPQRDYHWETLQGTSMSCPFAAGAVALWLQADPTLTVDEVTDIIRQTAIRDDYVENGDPAQWGAGKLDVLAGIKEVLRRSAGIGSIFADDEKAVVIRRTADSVYDIYMAGADRVRATLYNIAGAVTATAEGSAGQLTLDASVAAPGVYLLAIDSPASRITRKIVVR